MTWSIHFIPNETDHIDVTIDGSFSTRGSRPMGIRTSR